MVIITVFISTESFGTRNALLFKIIRIIAHDVLLFKTDKVELGKKSSQKRCNVRLKPKAELS